MEYLSALTGANVWLKLECRQPTGSFKVRGALNKIGLLSPEERARGLVTGSAGNHGLGVAFACQAWGGVKTDIFVPGNAPRAKIEKLKRFAVTVHVEGSSYEEVHQAAEEFARQTGATYVQAYDDPDVIAGQGTAGLEILSDMPDVDTVLVPVGGGRADCGHCRRRQEHGACLPRDWHPAGSQPIGVAQLPRWAGLRPLR